ncbi:unnamed protein product, partial [Nesidiocoris tenuis]
TSCQFIRSRPKLGISSSPKLANVLRILFVERLLISSAIKAFEVKQIQIHLNLPAFVLKSKTSKKTIPSADQGNCEDNLLTWLTDIFTISRPNCVYPRIITNLVYDLEDGVVLGVITMFFCPFLFDNYLTSLYLNPCNIAE